jgi:hypothetical protein
MTELEALALATEIERQPGWLAEAFEGLNQRWYIVAGRDNDPLTFVVVRNRRDWEHALELLRD